MNGVGKKRHSETKLGAKSEVYFCTPPLCPPQHCLGRSAYRLHKDQLKTLQQLDLQQKQDVIHILLVYKSLFIIWPSGLLTFYGLLQV